MTVNKVILVGNLGADPEVRTANSGTTFATLRVATSERQKGQDGTWEEKTEWHRVSVIGRAAENCGRYLKKGAKVYIEGKLETKKWTDQEGKDRYSTEVVTFDVRFLDSRRAEGGGGGNSGGGSARREPEPEDPGAGTAPDEDIPF